MRPCGIAGEGLEKLLYVLFSVKVRFTSRSCRTNRCTKFDVIVGLRHQLLLLFLLGELWEERLRSVIIMSHGGMLAYISGQISM